MWLVKRLIKNYKEYEDVNVRKSYGLLSGCMGILCNLLLFTGKLWVGLLTKSLAVTADGFNNLADASSSLVGMVGSKGASRPADKEHPFGHGRLEYVAALVVAILVIQFGLSFLKNSFLELFRPSDIRVRLYALLFLGFSILVKGWLYYFNKKVGVYINSQLMQAVALDSIADICATTVTLASIAAKYLWDVNIDGLAGILVSLLIIWSGVMALRDILHPLLGEKADELLAENIKKIVAEEVLVKGSHDLVVHNYGPGRNMASIHVEISKEIDAETSHEAIDAIEKRVEKELGVELVIHMDPIETRDSLVLEKKERLEKVLNILDKKVSFHDFRVVAGKSKNRLIFDLVVPYDYSAENKEKIKKNVADLMEEFYQGDTCQIHVETEY